MTIDQNLTALANSQIRSEEIRSLIDSEMAEEDLETTDLRLALAADLLCDAAMEVVAQMSEEPTISKMVVLDDNTQIELSEMSIVGSLHRAYETGAVNLEELQALLLRSSVANAVARALEGGATPEDIAGGTIQLKSIRLDSLLKKQARPKSFLARIFGRT